LLVHLIGEPNVTKKFHKLKKRFFNFNKYKKRKKIKQSLFRYFGRPKKFSKEATKRKCGRIFHLNILLKRIISEVYGFDHTLPYLYSVHKKTLFLAYANSFVNFIVQKSYKINWAHENLQKQLN
jgi:hypothetical protein